MLSSALPPVLLALACTAPGPRIAWSAPSVGTAADLRLASRGDGAASPGEAAEQARRQTGGGQVLSVRRRGDGYEVKVLTPGGEVRLVFVPAAGS